MPLYSTEPVTVFVAPDLSDVPDDELLTLERGVWLPELGANFEPLDLWRARTPAAYGRRGRQRNITT